jgi:hypothetical protein
LDHRSQGGLIEFLVRYRDSRITDDIWVKSTDLTCYHKILEHYDGKVQAGLTPRQQPKAPAVPPIPPEDPDSGIAIVGIDRTKNGDILITYRMRTEKGARVAYQSEFTQLYRKQFSNYMIDSLGKRFS